MNASPRRTRIKVCGVVRPEDAAVAADLGADAVGVNFCPTSSRYAGVERARAIAAVLPPGVDLVGVFADEQTPAIRRLAWDVGFSTIQLHGEELAHQVFRLAPFRVIKAFRWKTSAVVAEIGAYIRDLSGYIDEGTNAGATLSAILIDAFREGQLGGTGSNWKWSEADGVEWPAPIFVAGGLNPENIADAVRTLRPYGVDVAGGVESAPGVKDRSTLEAFIAAVREADADARG